MCGDRGLGLQGKSCWFASFLVSDQRPILSQSIAEANYEIGGYGVSHDQNVHGD